MKETKICVIGLGYVGLPLARLFSTKYPTVGFDMNQKRCDALMAGHDATLEVADDILQDAINNHGFICTSDIEKIKDCNFYVVAVPTTADVPTAFGLAVPAVGTEIFTLLAGIVPDI